MKSNNSLPRQLGRNLGVALTIAAFTTGCSVSTQSAPAAMDSASPSMPAGGAVSPSSSVPSAHNESQGTDGGQDEAPVAADKDGVTVHQPVLKDSGDAFWVGVKVTNSTAKPADVHAMIRLTGPLGYHTLLEVRVDALEPGRAHDGVYTAQDKTPGAIIPDHPAVVVVDVTRTPS